MITTTTEVLALTKALTKNNSSCVARKKSMVAYIGSSVDEWNSATNDPASSRLLIGPSVKSPKSFVVVDISKCPMGQIQV
jgi:hypothetical protein